MATVRCVGVGVGINGWVFVCIDVCIGFLVHFKGHTFDVFMSTVRCVGVGVGDRWVGICVYSCVYWVFVSF